MAPYTPTAWVNDQAPALNATNLNKLTDELESQAAAKGVAHSLPNWVNGTVPALSDAAPLNEMERVVQAVAASLSLSYTPTVWSAGWSPARNATRMNKLETQVQSNRVAIDATPPPTGALKWAPPTLTNPQTLVVSNSNRSFDMNAGQDYIIQMPASAITAPGGVTLRGGRNIRMIGGEIYNGNDRGCSAPNDGNEYGLLIESNTGVVHIEGVWIHGAGIGQCVLFSNGWTPAEYNLIVQLQNCRFESLHRVSTNGTHTDGIQSWHGPHTLRMYQVSIVSQGVCIQTQPYDVVEDQAPLANWHYERVDLTQLNQSVNCVEQGSPHHTYALWKWGGTAGQATAKWSEYHKDMWLSAPESDASGVPENYTAWASVGMPTGWAGWNPGGSWPITGEAIHLGPRPGGNYVPVGAAGVGYVSPGYA